MVSAPARMRCLPTAVEPVNDTMSTRGSVPSCAATSFDGVGTTLTTPGGMSVCSAINRPSRVAFHGVFGSGLSTTVLPAASAGPSLLRITSIGKFDGVMAATTPTGSLTTVRALRSPNNPPPSSLRSQPNSSISRAGYRSASASGQSSWALCVVMTGQPASAISSSRRSSRSASIASCSCPSARLRSTRLVDQSDSSNARRAAPIAASMSCTPAAVVEPMTTPVAGLRLSNSAPDAVRTSSPPISMRFSALTAARRPNSTLSVAATSSLNSHLRARRCRQPCPPSPVLGYCNSYSCSTIWAGTEDRMQKAFAPKGSDR